MKFYLRIFLALFYELFILITIALLVSSIFTLFFNDFEFYLKRTIHQFLIWTSWGVYFIFSWKMLKQTIAMRAWKLKIKLNNYSYYYLVKRYIKISFFWVFFPLNFIAIFYLKNRFLHDKNSNNLIIDAQNKPLRK